MVDKAKAWEILVMYLDISTLYNKYEEKYLLEVGGTKGFIQEGITKDNFDILTHCLNAEEDSMEKIFEEFKGLGVIIDERFTDDDVVVLKEIHSDDILLEIHKREKFVSFINYKDVIIDVLRLINRIYRLWGVGV